MEYSNYCSSAKLAAQQDILWLEVTVSKDSGTQRVIKKANIEMDSVGDVVSDSIESDYKVKSVQGFTSLKRDQWEVPIELDVSMPVSALQAFQVKRMLIKVCPKGPVDGSTEGVANAFDVLKEAQRTYASLPKER